jgi:hypothetical protein
MDLASLKRLSNVMMQKVIKCAQDNRSDFCETVTISVIAATATKTIANHVVLYFLLLLPCLIKRASGQLTLLCLVTLLFVSYVFLLLCH